MFKKSTPVDTTGLDTAIDAAFEGLKKHDPHSEEYAAIMVQIGLLYNLRYPPKVPNTVSKDALIAVAGNLIGIVAILGFEKSHVITTKALNFIMKTKV
jgi:hypothetical protein